MMPQPTEQYTVGWGIMDASSRPAARPHAPTHALRLQPRREVLPSADGAVHGRLGHHGQVRRLLCQVLRGRRVAREEGLPHHEVPGAPRPRRAPPLVGSHDQDQAALLGKVGWPRAWRQRGVRPVASREGIYAWARSLLDDVVVVVVVIFYLE